MKLRPPKTKIQSRRIPNTSVVRPIIWFPSLKTRQSQFCDSLLERDYLLTLEYDDTIESYVTQPISFSYTNRYNRRTRYTPDCYVKPYVDSPSYIEVKTASQARKPSIAEKIEWLNDILLAEEEAPLKLVTSDEIRPNKLIKNMNMLYQYRPIACKEQLAEDVRPFIESKSTFTMSELEFWTRKYLGKTELAWSYIGQNIEKFEVAKTTLLKKKTIMEITL
jgi:hypothetical protein